MSYCRWSDNDGQCDVYVYADCSGGYTTHVARSRRVYSEPLPEPVPLAGARLDEWMARRKTMEEIWARSERQEIGLPCDGESFNDETPEECANRLEGLREMGYVVPQYAIDELRAGG